MNTQLTTHNQQRTTNKQDWRLYAAAGAAALAAGSAADAAIIYGNLNIDLSIPTGVPAHATTAKQTFNIDGVVESAILQAAPGGVGKFHASARLAGPLNVFAAASTVSAAINFPKGQPIGGNYLLASAEQLAGRTGNTHNPESGLFTGGAVGFAGFELGNGDIGWLKVQVPATDGYPDELKVLGYAYNDASGAPITADQGDQSSVPEPSALGLLAMGSAGVLAWRRRRTAPAR